MKNIDKIANELLESGICKTTKEAYEYAKYLKNYTKALYKQNFYGII